ncbi:MAG TPA: HAD-IIA family hydrolase [Verrucomicrobiota bacterium]|jgi:NagD protein|nr:HAD-IIA family hydrolase [Verrucomicrobiota bacterium]HPY31868.1 HAD-IIA family hydrolase [Verrucomicrobiota bacterium]HQB17603.1 HAD-IIA family hydrolase [Verrucomicrobiota bacterium]
MKKLSQLRHVALDMDGTIYSGGTLFEFTRPFLAQLDRLGVGYTFLTNNSSKSSRDYLARLGRLGIEAAPHQLYTSTQAAIEFFREQRPELKRLFILGTPSMIEEMTEAGFVSTADHADDEPDAALVAFDTGLNYARLCRTAWWISRGKPFIATHPDFVCPTDEPTVLVDCGAVCAALQAATGRAPDVVLGKPDPCMIRGILHRHNLQPHQLAMVGDRLYTDMAMAQRAGAVGVLVLTGETIAEQAAAANPKPDVVLPSIKELGEQLEAVQKHASADPAR